MAGIIDRKSRIIDYSLTENGRSQIQSGDIRFVYASISDRSILYEKDYEKSLDRSEDVSYTGNYLPFEVNTKNLTSINKEMDLRSTFSIIDSNILRKVKDQNSSYSNITFDNALDIFIEQNSLSNSIKNLKLITHKTFLKSEGISFIKNSDLDKDFDFSNINFIKRYPTIKRVKSKNKDLNSIALDKRFEHKTNFMKLIPEDIEGNKLYDLGDFRRDEADYNDLCIDLIYKSFNSKLDYNNINNREELILNVIKEIEKNNDIQSRKYQLIKTTEIDSFIFNMYEVDENSESLEKLSIVKLGKMFEKESGSTKTIYLVGKIINTKNDSKDLESIYSFNKGEILKNTKNTNFAVSAYYSFVCLFTIVLE